MQNLRISLLLSLLLLSLLTVSSPMFPHQERQTVVFAQLNPPSNETIVYNRTVEYTVDMPCFNPTKLTFNYPYTHFHSISDISTIGASLYKYSGGPNYFEFIAQDIDDYQFRFELRYEATANQTILMGIWSGTGSMMGFDYKASGEVVVFNVRLRVTREPTYPSEKQVADQVVLQVQQRLQEYYQRIEELTKNQNSAILTASVLAVVAVAASIVGTVIHLIELKRVTKRLVR